MAGPLTTPLQKQCRKDI